MRRQIIYSTEFDRAAEAYGGYPAIDTAIETVVEALSNNPYAFPKFENDFVSFRYILIKSIGLLPALVIMFTIDARGNVILENVEDASIY